MTIYTVLIIAMALVVLLGMGAAALMLLGSRRNIALERLHELKTLGKEKEETGRSKSYEEQQLEKPFFERVIFPILDRMAGKFKKKGSGEDAMAEMLMMAGNPGNLTPAQFKALQLLVAVVSVTGVILLTLVILPLTLGLLFAAVAGILSLVFPKFYIGTLITKRQKEIKKTLPSMLDLLTVSVEAGLGFDQAVQKVVEKAEGALSEEFDRMLQEVNMGKPRKDALKALAERSKVEELQTLVAAIIQADTLGVAIGNILRIQSEQMRTKRRQAIEEAAQKLPIKMLFPMIFFIFPTIFIVVLGPIALKVYSELAKYGII